METAEKQREEEEAEEKRKEKDEGGGGGEGGCGGEGGEGGEGGVRRKEGGCGAGGLPSPPTTTTLPFFFWSRVPRGFSCRRTAPSRCRRCLQGSSP